MKHLPLIMAMLLSGSALAEETVYYCSEDGNTGFLPNEKTGQYEQAGFIPQRFKMKLLDDGDLVIDDPVLENQANPAELHLARYSCGRSEMLSSAASWKTCISGFGFMFNFNLDSGRFVLMRGTGYVFSGGKNGNGVHASIGTCSKF